MPTFEKNTYVKCKTADGRPLRGRVTAKRGKVVRIVGRDGRQYTTSSSARGEKIELKSIKPVSFGVFVLDTQLDKGWRSRRQGARFWDEYCHHAGWTFAYERVHSLADLSYVLGQRSIDEHVLLFNGHGCSSDGWRLSNGDHFNAESQIKVNERNKDKLVMFSSCSIGSNPKLCQHYRDLLGAEAVVAYRTPVRDPICFIAEPALFQLVYEDHSPADAVNKVAVAMAPWKSLNRKHSRQFPLVCF